MEKIFTPFTTQWTGFDAWELDGVPADFEPQCLCIISNAIFLRQYRWAGISMSAIASRPFG